MAILRRGFTLIEMLIVVALLGVLAVVFLSAINPIHQVNKARDTRRSSDLGQYRNSLENFAAANGTMYPAYASGDVIAAGAGLCQTLLDDGFLTDCPVDDKVPYQYLSDGTLDDGSAGAVQYVLWTELNEGSYWVVCSEGRAGETASAPLSSNCPL